MTNAHTRRPSRRRRWPGLALVGGIVVAVVIGPAVLGGGSRANVAVADPAPAYTATASPTTNLFDGQAVTINVHSTLNNVVYEGRAAVCRAGVTYQNSDGQLYAPDSRPDGPNCPLAPISTSADPAVVDNDMTAGAATPEGESMILHVGVGVATWTDLTGTDRSLTCDPTHACDLLVEIYGGPADGSAPPVWVPFVTQLTYQDSDPLVTCGGAATGVLSSGGADSLVDAWTQWTLDQCKRPGQTGAATEASFVGEGPAVQEFDGGTLDLAYTAAGADHDVGLDPAGTPRPSVAVPVAIGAETVGVGNGFGRAGKKVPFPTVSMTPAEVAELVGSGQYLSNDQEAPIINLNPDLGANFFAPSTDLQVGVPSGISSSTYDLSKYLSTVARDTWKVPPVGAAGSAAGQDRGVFNDFATSSPDFSLLTTYSGRPALQRALLGIVGNTFLLGGVYVVSDLTTATAESLTPVAIQTTPSGPFVSPTAASMDAAVAEMTADAGGMLQPDPAPSDPNAYPMTYVVYALVPSQPLVDANCNPRTASQTQLTTWLNYLTGPGQQALPPGLVPITPALAAQATTAIAQVGATPNTCTPSASTGDNTGGDSSSGGSGDSGTGDDAFGSTGSQAAGSDANSVSATGASPLKGNQAVVAKVRIPSYGGSGSASVIVTVAALLGVVALITLAARLTSNATGSSDAEPDPDPDESPP
jgi:hypothetical protein